MNIKFRDVSLALLAASVLTLAACAHTKDDSTVPPADSTTPAPADSTTTPPAETTTPPPADSAAPASTTTP